MNSPTRLDMFILYITPTNRLSTIACHTFCINHALLALKCYTQRLNGQYISGSSYKTRRD